MKQRIIRIATRKSPLALWQANHIKQALQKIYPDIEIELIGMLTQADKLLSTPLAKIGGKGLFVKELENALLEQRADIAVHSIKDLPAQLPAELMLAVICEREDPRDVFVTEKQASLAELPVSAIIGTSSLRRQCQLLALRPDIITENLRGNVETRLQKLIEKKFDAIVLAAAGLKRLHQTNMIQEYFNPEKFIPAIGQGAIGIECREQDMQIRELIAVLDHLPTRYCVTAERAMNFQFGGNCQIPVAAYAMLKQDRLQIQAMIGKPDGSLILKSFKTGEPVDAEMLGYQVAEDLFAQGAREILQEL